MTGSALAAGTVAQGSARFGKQPFTAIIHPQFVSGSLPIGVLPSKALYRPAVPYAASGRSGRELDRQRTEPGDRFRIS